MPYLVVLALLLVTAACGKITDTISSTLGTSSGTPPPGAVLGAVDFPPPGATWVLRETSYNEATRQAQSKTSTWTAIGERPHAGRRAYHVSDGTTTHVHDRVSGSWLAVLDPASREMIAYEPNDGTFASPLWVGKSWDHRYTRHDRLGRRSLYNALIVWKVVAFEDVRVSAGTFKAFRVEAWPDDRDPVRKRTYWYAPAAKLIVKETTEGLADPYGIGVSRDRTQRTIELVEYSPPAPPAAATPVPRATQPAEQGQTPAARVRALTGTLERDTGDGRRVAAAEALAQFAPPVVNPALTALRSAARNDPAGPVRLAAARTLMTIGRTLPEAAASLVTIAATVPEAVIAMIEASRDPSTAVVAIGLLGKVGAPARAAAPILLDAVKSGADDATRAAAATALGSIGLAPDEAPSLIAALRDRSAAVREAAATSLVSRRTEVLAVIEAEQRNEDVEVRKRATRALGSLGRAMPDVVPLLAGALEDRDAGIRIDAVRALREVGPQAFATMRTALKHDEPDVRAAAAEAIVAVPADKAEAVAPLIDALGDRDAAVRASAVRALASLGRVAQPAAARLRAVADGDASADVRASAARALDAISGR